MEIREFAQSVLFSTTLEEKLAAGGILTDEDPGSRIATPSEPGRPVELRLRRDGVKADFPAEAKLINEEQRGILLHFFANHELLATELMALVLLKFPDAPPEFRQGILQTLREEQLHTQWYLNRMKQCGIAFGDFPVNRFFWDTIATMESPLDYVTRLSLTFEQANLDYARHYAAVLRQAGDDLSSRILARIYRDEIGHVGYGLKWFRRWKAAGQSDWDAYRRQLAFPLSPARGRGNVPFNAEGRKKAGLDETFIHEIEIFSRSKGRTPNVFLMNHDAEPAMAYGLDGKGYTPRQEARSLAKDLEILPAFLCRRDDVVLLSQKPSGGHCRKLHDLGFEIPEFEELGPDGRLRPDSLLRTRKLNELRPWAWSPQSAKVLQELNPDFVKARWNEATRRLFAKDWQARHLGITNAICQSADDVAAAARKLAGAGCGEAVAKASFGAAGQRNRKFATADPQSVRSWVERVLKIQGAVVIEPWLMRVFDFSVHYDHTPAGLRRLAFVQMENDRRGQFQACVAAPKFCRGAPPELAKFLMNGALDIYDDEIPRRLAPLLDAAGYQGPLGIDAFVYRDLDGRLHLRPVVELNPRFTMGRLTWELMRRVAAGRRVRFELVRAADPGRRVRELENVHPPVLGRNGKLMSGTVVLNEGNHVMAVLKVGD